MSGLVVDVSVVLAWLYDHEDEPLADKALEGLEREGDAVPQLWHFGARNSLLIAERCGRISTEEVEERLDALKGLPIVTDAQADLQSVFDLAKEHELFLYDAIYLELCRSPGSLGQSSPHTLVHPGHDC